MDLISAKVEAAERSRKDRKPVFVSVLPDGECELVANYPGPEKALAYFVNGSEKPVPSQSEIEASVKPAKKETKAKESPDKKVSKKMKTTSQSAIGAKSPKAKKAGGAKGSKPAKKPKDRKPRSSKPGEMYGKAVSGASKELSVEQIVKALKEGKTVRNKAGFYYSPKFLATRKDKTKKHTVWVREAQR